MREVVVLGSVVLGVSLSLMVLAVSSVLGVFDPLVPHFAGSCTVVPGPPGPEDIAIDRQAGLAYLSSDDRRAYRHGTDLPGRIYRLDLSKPASAPQALAGTEQISPFHPHGISLFRTDRDQVLLFVVNHTVPGQPRAGHSVEIFAVSEDGLRHLDTIANLLFRSPNDIAAVGPRQFYLTNDQGYLDGMGMRLERFFGLANSDVVYFDGQVASVVLNELAFANGIQFDARTDRVLITETRADSLRIYRRTSADGSLSFDQAVEVGRGPDNIDIDEQGHIWIATHPNMVKLLAHASSPQALSPSRVVRLESDGTGLEDVYVGSGEELSAASIAAVHNGEMLLGAVFESKLLRCRLPEAHERA